MGGRGQRLLRERGRDVKVADTLKISSDRIQCGKRVHGGAASQLFCCSPIGGWLQGTNTLA